MSWQCAEGPYGRYPGEDGYEEDLTRHTVEQMWKRNYGEEYDEVCNRTPSCMRT